MDARDGDFERMQSPVLLLPRSPVPGPPHRRSQQPPPRELLLHQTTLESTLSTDLHDVSHDERLSQDDDDDDELASGDDGGAMPSRRLSAMRGSYPQAPNGTGADNDALFMQSTEYVHHYASPPPRKGKGKGDAFRTLSRHTSETVRLSVQDHDQNATSTRQSLETGFTLNGGSVRRRTAYDQPLIAGGAIQSDGNHHHHYDHQEQEQKDQQQRTYFHGSFRANSYFAIRLLRITQFIAAVDATALVFFYGYRRGKSVQDDYGALFVSSPFTAIFHRGNSCAVTISLAAIVYHLLPAVIVLGLPASGLRIFEPFKREDRIGPHGRIQKVKRTIFLQFCEMTAIVVFLVTGLVAVIALYHILIGELFNCTENASVYVFGAVAMLVYVLLYAEIRYFMRFREHLKMQLGAFSEADQTGDVRAHYLRSKRRRKRVQDQLASKAAAAAAGENTNGGADSGGALPTTTVTATRRRAPARRQIIAFVRKRLYRGAQLGDIRLLKRTLRIARNHLGMDFAKELYPDATIRLWFFSQSTKNPMHVAAYSGSIAAMELLFRANFPVNSFDKISRVRFSTGDIFWNMAKWFIRQPVVTAEDSYGASSIFKSTLVTPLHCAVSTGRIDAVRWLLMHGADVNLCSRSSFRHESRLPPIFLADHPEIAKELLASGANHLVIPDPGHMNTITVLQMAYLRGNYAVAQVLENWGGDVALTPLHTAAAMNNTIRIRQLLRKKVNPDCLGELGYIGLNKRTPLHWACVNGAIDAVELLLGANADANAQDARGRTPLHWAARVNQVSAVKILLEKGADPNIVDEGGMTAVLCASCAGGTTAQMFTLLVRSGANINHQLPSTGDTALHIAVKLDDLSTAMALLSVGGDIMRMNHDGLRPIDCTTSTRLQFEIKRAAGNRDVMISYTHSHKEFALKLRKSMEDANITTWLDLMDPSGIGGGAVWREEIARGVTNAAVVVCILTQDYAQSQWCMKELALAKQVGTPILAISTENAHISEELQVYLYTRQIIPFEKAIAQVDQLSEKEIQYKYDDAAYKQQVRLLLDGLRDEIEKRRELMLRKNLHLSRVATASSMNTGGTSTLSTFTGNMTLAPGGGGEGGNQADGGARGTTFANAAAAAAAAGGRGRGTGMWIQGSAVSSGGVANTTIHFDERAPAAMLQEKMMLESTSRDGFLFSSAMMGGGALQFNAQSGRGRNCHAAANANDRCQSSPQIRPQRQQQLNRHQSLLFDPDGSMFSGDGGGNSTFMDRSRGGSRLQDQSFGGLGVDDLTKSIILNQNGYYVHQPDNGSTGDGGGGPQTTGGESGPYRKGSVIDTFEQAKEMVDDGQQFVFICHGDWHVTFVGRLCAALCRDGGLHCFVDHRHRRGLGRFGSRGDDATVSPQQPPDRGSDGDDDDRNEDLLTRIHEAKEAILKCSAFVVILSDQTLRSQLVKDQLAFAEDKGKKIIPVVVNPLEFSLDVQYTLSRSDFHHFLTSGDMVGFDKSLENVLAELREEIYGIFVDNYHQPMASAAAAASPAAGVYSSSNQIDKSFILDPFSSSFNDSSFNGGYPPQQHQQHGYINTEQVLRRRLGSGSAAGSVTGSDRGWLDLPPSIRGVGGTNNNNQSFISSASSSRGGVGGGSSSNRPLSSDTSLHQSMLGNFSSLMRRITDEFDDDGDDDTEDAHLIVDGDDLDLDLDLAPELMRSVSENQDDELWSMSGRSNTSFMGGGGGGGSSSRSGRLRSFHNLYNAGNAPSRPGRLSSIQSNSARSVSILERGSNDTTDAASIDAVRFQQTTSGGDDKSVV